MSKTKEEIALEIWDKNLPDPIKKLLGDFAIEHTYPVRGIIRDLLKQIVSELPQSPSPAAWVKASERLPPEGIEKQRISIRYKGNPDVLIFTEGRWCWYDEKGNSDWFVVKGDSWSAIEWLDESRQAEGEAVGFSFPELKNAVLMTSVEERYELLAILNDNLFIKENK